MARDAKTAAHLETHAWRRAKERYGVTLTTADLRKIKRSIQDHRATLVERQSRRVTVWDVEHDGRTFRVVYDSNRRALSTFLAPGMVPSARPERERCLPAELCAQPIEATS